MKIKKPAKISEAVHELNNNLQGIIGNAILMLEEEKKLSFSSKSKANNIIICAERASDVVKKIVKLTSKEITEVKKTDTESKIITDDFSAPVPYEKRAVLVVDDEDLVRSFVADTLQIAGYSPIVAETGAEAVKLFEENIEHLRCVILDLTMPYMSGSLVLAKLKAIDPNVPVFLMSGYMDLQLGATDSQLKVAGFIKKPFKPNELLNLLDKLNETQIAA